MEDGDTIEVFQQQSGGGGGAGGGPRTNTPRSMYFLLCSGPAFQT